MAQTFTLTNWHAYLQQKNTWFASSLSPEMWVLLGLVAYVDPTNAPVSILEQRQILWPIEGKWGKFPLMPGIWISLVRTTHSSFSPKLTPSCWKQEGATAGNEWGSEHLSSDHSGILAVNPLHRQLGCSKEVNLTPWLGPRGG